MNDALNMLNYSNCLMFADDLKMFYPVKSILDAMNFQLNCLSLNLRKCKTMFFHRKMCPIWISYKIDFIELEKASQVKDLEVLFACTLSFTWHIDLGVSKAYSMLGFIIRICTDFNAVSVFIFLYYAYVRSQLENVKTTRFIKIELNSSKRIFCLLCLRSLGITMS